MLLTYAFPIRRRALGIVIPQSGFLTGFARDGRILALAPRLDTELDAHRFSKISPDSAFLHSPVNRLQRKSGCRQWIAKSFIAKEKTRRFRDGFPPNVAITPNVASGEAGQPARSDPCRRGLMCPARGPRAGENRPQGNAVRTAVSLPLGRYRREFPAAAPFDSRADRHRESCKAAPGS
jgi:hypothetical protein